MLHRIKGLAFEHIIIFQPPLQVGIDRSGKGYPLVQVLLDMPVILQVEPDEPHVQATGNHLLLRGYQQMYDGHELTGRTFVFAHKIHHLEDQIQPRFLSGFH